MRNPIVTLGFAFAEISRITMAFIPAIKKATKLNQLRAGLDFMYVPDAVV
jgi:hypothetical protein